MTNHGGLQALPNEIHTVTSQNDHPARALYSVENYAHSDDTQSPYEILGIPDGRALWKINGQVVGDHFGSTTGNHKPIDFIMLTQIYGNADSKTPVGG